jgi:hypothetical protein
MEKFGWTFDVKNEEILFGVKDENEGRLTGLVTSCVGTAFLKEAIEVKIEDRRRGRRRRNQLLDDVKEKRR